MSEHQHSESGRSRNERRQHDAAARHEASRTEPYRWFTKRNSAIVTAIVVILIVSLTFMFVAGFIRW